MPMPILMTKNSTAQIAVERDKKFAEPRAPKTVPEAPAPKLEPAWAPAPRCIRIRPIIKIAMMT